MQDQFIDITVKALDPQISYILKRSNTRNVLLNCFNNRVFVDKDDHGLTIQVDHLYELPAAYQDKLILGKEETHLKTYKRVFDLEPDETLIRKMDEKYSVDRTVENHILDNFYSNHPEVRRDDLNNVFSGTNVHLKYGEGILDFIYADFKTPYKNWVAIYEHNIEYGKELAAEYGFDSEDHITDLYEQIHHKDPIKADAQVQDAFYEDFVDTMLIAQKMIYASLYSAVCPPIFYHALSNTYTAMKEYSEYLIELQKEYMDLLEFCFDDDYNPEIIGKLSPAKRYAIYRMEHGLSTQINRNEVFRVGINSELERKIAYSTDSDVTVDGYNLPLVNDPDVFRDYTDKGGIHRDSWNTLYSMPFEFTVSYTIHSLAQMLEFELSKMIEDGVRFKRCRRCGRYFLLKGNYNTNYCDRIDEGETRTCQQLAAIENYKRRHEGDEAIALYQKYYKRYAARLKVNQIKEEDFNMWRYEAMTKRDECSLGKISPEDFRAWLESCFPNRKKKAPPSKNGNI